MNSPKDNFSKQAAGYALFRPVYPEALYDFLYTKVTNFTAAWDCGTGNGQVASVLADKFANVYATDISGNQLAIAIAKDNIIYKTERAEQTSFPDNSFDLITIAQAIHWFDLVPFYREAARVGKDGCIIAAWGYNLLRVTPAIDKIIDNFYFKVIGSYWDQERSYIDGAYENIKFPFNEIVAPAFEIKTSWTSEQVIGYLNSWSSVQHYIQNKGINPVLLIEKELIQEWGNETRELVFPLFMRVGCINK